MQILFLQAASTHLVTETFTSLVLALLIVIQPKLHRGAQLGEMMILFQLGDDQARFQKRVREVLSKQNIQRLPVGATDWTGRVLGSITVTAFSHVREKRGKRRVYYWVVKCVCGKYEMRNEQSFRKFLQTPHAHRFRNFCQSCSNEASRIWHARNIQP